ncbi:MAG: hypothetical protein ACE5PT_08705 [Gemmatimonadales bacterium]
MEWLPGTQLFGSHTPVLWLNAALGATLGFVATRVRAAGTVFEGKVWMLGLGTVAGVIAGTTLALFWGLLIALFEYVTGETSAGALLGMSVLSQLALFAVVVLRRRY